MHTTLTQQGNCTMYQYGNLCRMRLITSQSSYQYVKVNKNGNSRRDLRVDNVGTNPKKNKEKSVRMGYILKVKLMIFQQN